MLFRSGFFQESGVVFVKRDKVVRVLNGNDVTCFRSKVRHDHCAVECGFNGFIRIGDDVDAVMFFNRIESTGYRSFQRREEEEALDTVSD